MLALVNDEKSIRRRKKILIETMDEVKPWHCKTAALREPRLQLSQRSVRYVTYTHDVEFASL